MVQCIINIILLYSPPIISSVVQPGPAERVTVCQWLVVCWQRQVQRCQAAQCAVCQLQLWTGALLTTTMALKLITLALTALVLVQVGHGSCSHSNLQYSVRETSGLTTSQDAPVCGVWE